VYRDPADLLAQLDDALSIASPGSAHLTQDVLEHLMREALNQAKLGMSRGEVPIGAVIARGDATIVAGGYNEMQRTQNKVAHAEIQAFGNAAGKAPLDARDLILVSTLEPCVMCTGAAIQAAIDTVIYALRAPADRGTSRVKPPQSPETQMPRIVGDILWRESLEMFKEWLPKNETSIAVPYVKQLLALHSGTPLQSVSAAAAQMA
jgi:tRNA(adenine34) deaminase